MVLAAQALAEISSELPVTAMAGARNNFNPR
jgi:hypothetical protein